MYCVRIVHKKYKTCMTGNTLSGKNTHNTRLSPDASRCAEKRCAAQLMRRMASEGFRVERIEGMQRITHDDEALFGAYGFISEESPVQQLDLVLDEGTPTP